MPHSVVAEEAAYLSIAFMQGMTRDGICAMRADLHADLAFETATLP